MPTTPNYALPYPVDSDPVDVPGDLQALAEAIDGLELIRETLIDAKGDLIVGTGADAVTRVAVSASNGDVLTAASGEASGVKWAAPANNIASAILAFGSFS